MVEEFKKLIVTVLYSTPMILICCWLFANLSGLFSFQIQNLYSIYYFIAIISTIVPSIFLFLVIYLIVFLRKNGMLNLTVYSIPILTTLGDVTITGAFAYFSAYFYDYLSSGYWYVFLLIFSIVGSFLALYIVIKSFYHYLDDDHEDSSSTFLFTNYFTHCVVYSLPLMVLCCVMESVPATIAQTNITFLVTYGFLYICYNSALDCANAITGIYIFRYASLTATGQLHTYGVEMSETDKIKQNTRKTNENLTYIIMFFQGFMGIVFTSLVIWHFIGNYASSLSSIETIDFPLLVIVLLIVLIVLSSLIIMLTPRISQYCINNNINLDNVLFPVLSSITDMIGCVTFMSTVFLVKCLVGL